MVTDELILIRCRISRSGFSSERVFRVNRSDGPEHIGAAPVRYFFTEGKKPLPPDQPAERGVQIKGFLTGRVVLEESAEVILVSVPSGEVLRVNRQETAEYPQEGRAHVSVQS